jgi:hypothetical protein
LRNGEWRERGDEEEERAWDRMGGLVERVECVHLCSPVHLCPYLLLVSRRLVDVIPYLLPGVNTVNCLLHPKGIDSAQLSWRGAAILAKAETTRDMVRGAEHGGENACISSWSSKFD